MNHYAIETAKNRQADLQAEARMARLRREAGHGRQLPDVTEARVLRHRIVSATAGLIVAVGLLAGTALAQPDRPSTAPSAGGNQPQVTKRNSGDTQQPRLPGGRVIR